MISCAGVTGSVGITHHARITQIAGLNPQSSRAQVAEDRCTPTNLPKRTFTCMYVRTYAQYGTQYSRTLIRVLSTVIWYSISICIVLVGCKHRASEGVFYIGGRGFVCQIIEPVTFARCAFIFAYVNHMQSRYGRYSMFGYAYIIQAPVIRKGI